MYIEPEDASKIVKILLEASEKARTSGDISWAFQLDGYISQLRP